MPQVKGGKGGSEQNLSGKIRARYERLLKQVKERLQRKKEGRKAKKKQGSFFLKSQYMDCLEKQIFPTDHSFRPQTSIFLMLYYDNDLKCVGPQL